VDIRPAAELDRAELLHLFNASYSDYLVPMRMRAADLDEHLDLNTIDLTVSRVAHAGEPAAFALVGRRGEEGWIGGMGTHPDHRRRGLGEAALRAAVAAARHDGCAEVRLEVITGNLRAIALYEKLGFRRSRELVVAQLDPAQDQRGSGAPDDTVVEVGDRDAERWVARHGTGPEPWQRAGAVLARLRERGTPLRGVTVQQRGRTRAAAVLRDQETVTGVLQIAAEDAAAAAGLLRAVAAPERVVRLVNVPDGDPAVAALPRLGADLVARQYEMRLGA
jgi:GNAT superfamily N-acetyltransferase